jgi:hypothetical protein
MKAPKQVPLRLPSSLISPHCRCGSLLVYTDDDDSTVQWCLRCGRKKAAKHVG